MTGRTKPTVVSTKFRVGKKFVCEMSFGPTGLLCEWSPRVPTRLMKKDFTVYCQRRDAFLAEVALAIGGPVHVADIRQGNPILTVIRPEDAHMGGRA